MDCGEFRGKLSEIGFELSSAQFEALILYARLLEKWNPRINLVAPSTIPALWHRHFLDCAQLAAFIPTGRKTVDMGSGGGFPGLVLALVRPDLDVTLMESDQRKAAFLAEVTRGTRGAGLTLTNPPNIHSDRIENWKGDQFDVVTARALAPLTTLLKNAYRLLKKDGICLFLKGEQSEDELTEAKNSWHIQIEKKPSLTQSKSVILLLRDIKKLKE